MFRNYKGFMINQGELWISEVAPGRFKIVTIQNQTVREEKVNPRAPDFNVHPTPRFRQNVARSFPGCATSKVA